MTSVAVNPKSKHLPEVAGDIVYVTGVEYIETGLRNIQTFVATLAQPIVAGNEAIVTWELMEDVPGRVRVNIYKTTFAAGTAPCKISWYALGR